MLLNRREKTSTNDLTLSSRNFMSLSFKSDLNRED